MMYANCNKTETSMKVKFKVRRTYNMDLTFIPRYDRVSTSPCQECKYKIECSDWK